MTNASYFDSVNVSLHLCCCIRCTLTTLKYIQVSLLLHFPVRRYNEMGLSKCSMMDETPLNIPESDAVDVHKLTAKVDLCCQDDASCRLCLLIDAELHVQEGEDVDEHLHKQEASPSSVTAFVTLCYKTPPTFPACKRVDFTVDHTALVQNVAKVSLVIWKPAGVFFSSLVQVYSSKSLHPIKVVVEAPSLNEVCSRNPQQHIEECYVPAVSSVINREMNQVELKYAEGNMTFPLMCIQYETNGRCQSWKRKTIPLHSVAPCLCLQVWNDDDERRPRRFRSCPFKNEGFLHTNMRRNLSASVRHAHMNNQGHLLQWNLSAPCRLEGEVWPCRRTSRLSCIEIEGFRQLLDNTTWTQNTNGHWVQTGVFEDMDLQLSPCVMMKVGSEGLHLGPFCYCGSARWRWSLLVVAAFLLASLAALMFCLLHDFVKEWLSGSLRGGFAGLPSNFKVRISPHIVLLSPPDVHDGVSEAVCSLGCLLMKQDFSVCVDQWSRKEQCSLGPVPWLHSQLLHLKSLGGRMVLILTHKALELAHEWSRQHQEALKAKAGGGGDGDVPRMHSPYSDVFTASLCLIQGDKQHGRVGQRFLLVTFDPSVVQLRGSFPELFQGLDLLQLPSQMKPLLCELAGGGKQTAGNGEPRTGVD
ncbi:uncharacterized protein il17rc isoform X2 [Dunckerocampus dactyliophorus]|uniref:uncharacterized protein il17rc isoform X2 n=1 Tax=Dunckerocampus dactyliophorus TaxID=161453 RepID=UPI0024069B4E|nr:uncharacterized protein il17rc isoform X2 [Dunckerocampus dactyliophorus]